MLAYNLYSGAISMAEGHAPDAGEVTGIDLQDIGFIRSQFGENVCSNCELGMKYSKIFMS